jgi:arylsulfatase A-like enzyme
MANFTERNMIEPREERAPSLLLIAAWFALVTGICEGFGLLVFQRINWANWGNMVHVSVPVIWIAPIVDFGAALLLAALIWIASKLFARMPLLKTAVLVYASGMVYVWLALTDRLTYHSDLLLGIGCGVAISRWVANHEKLTFRIWRTSFPWIAGAVVLALVAGEGREWLRERDALAKLPPPAPNSPNVLVIVIDTLRADHMSAYGYSRQTTPNLDEFAKQSVVFDNAIAPSSWTLPSHASMLTGRYTYEHGADSVKSMSLVGHSMQTLDNRYPMLGEAMEHHGYRTAGFAGNRIFFSRHMGLGRGFTHFEDFTTMDMFPRTVLGRRLATLVLNHDKLRMFLVDIGFKRLEHLQMVGEEGIRKRGPAINEAVLDWIDKDRSRPFFAFLNYYDVHGPYGPRHSAGQKFSHGKGNNTDYYDDGVADMDTFIGHLLQELDHRGLTGNTLVIFTSDHGELLDEHGMLGHRNALYRQLISVPFMVRTPGLVPAGIRVETPVTISALPATVMEILGWGDQTQFPGPSLVELWKHPGPHPDWPYPLSELAQFVHSLQEWPSQSGSMQSMVSDKWHYIYHEKFGAQLYDWQLDKPELNNLSKTPDDMAVVQDLAGRVKDLTAKPREVGGEAAKAQSAQ